MASKVLSAAAPKSNHALALTNWLHDPFFRSGFGPMSLFRDNWPNMPASLADFAKFPLAMDLEETNNEIIAKVDIPSGVKFEDLKLTINDDGALVLSGERKEEKSEEHDNYHYRERSYGSFSRVIPFPQGTALEHLDASFNDHVLTVRVPKPQPVPKGKQVAIKRLDASLADSA